MRVIMISTDKNIFDKNSAVAKRMVDYGEFFGELHVVVFSLANLNFVEIKLSGKVFIYPTRSKNKFRYIFDAVKIARSISSKIYFGETVVTTQDPFETGIAGVFIKKITKLPLQIQIHTDFYSKEFYDGSLLNWFRFEISRLTLPYANNIRVVREKIKRDIHQYRKIGLEIITTLPIFVDINQLRNEPIRIDLRIKYPQFKKIILVVGRFSQEKNIGFAINLFGKLHKRIDGLGLVIVGDGKEGEKLREKVHRLHLNDRVAFEPWNQDMSSYYKTADLFLNTSFFEGYGMALVEAASLGCPILTSNVGIAQDYFNNGKDALICPVGDEDCFINKIITYFANYSIERKIGEVAYREMESRIIQKEEYLKKYKETLELAIKNK